MKPGKRSNWWGMWSMVACMGACATLPTTAMVDGQVVPRKTLEFTGQPYTVRHRAARTQE